jgi:hypothetical protein
MPDIDLHYSQSNCNPGKDKHYSRENVGASGTTPHRQIVLKRREAYCHLVFRNMPGLTAPCIVVAVRKDAPEWVKDASPIGD